MNLKPVKKTVRLASGSIPKSILSEAVKQNCSKETKFSIIDWIQRTYDKRTSDEVSHHIGLIEAKQNRKKEKSTEESSDNEEEGGSPQKKLKTDQKKPEERKKSPIKSPIKVATGETQKN